jgi:glycosyltransferase involved in cell wall biosynthesis
VGPEHRGLTAPRMLVPFGRFSPAATLTHHRGLNLLLGDGGFEGSTAARRPDRDTGRRSATDAREPPLVTIVVPCFESAAHVGEAIESALAQTHSPIEVIAIDDHSTDGTARVLRSFGRRIRVERLVRNSGPSAARNLGLNLARGEFVQFLDADDVLLPRKVELCLRAFEPDVDLVFSRIRYFLDSPPESRVWAADRLLLRALCPFRGRPLAWDPARAAEFTLRREVGTPAPLHRTSFLRRCGGFDEDLWSLEDIELLFRLAISGARMRMVDEVLVHCRHHGSPTRLRTRPGRFLVSLAALDSMHRLVLGAAHVPAGVRCALGDRYAKAGRRLLWEGHEAEARHAFARAAELSPRPRSTGFPMYNFAARVIGLHRAELLGIALSQAFHRVGRGFATPQSGRSATPNRTSIGRGGQAAPTFSSSGAESTERRGRVVQPAAFAHLLTADHGNSAAPRLEAPAPRRLSPFSADDSCDRSGEGRATRAV